VELIALDKALKRLAAIDGSAVLEDGQSLAAQKDQP
jgi:hypothetical protein